MYRLYRLTGEPEFAVAAARFDKPAFWAPLLAGADPLPGLHANTHLAQVVVACKLRGHKIQSWRGKPV